MGLKAESLELGLISSLLLMILFAGIASASSAPVIISWQNSKTNDEQTSLLINVSENISFKVTADEIIDNWNWTLNGVEQKHNFNSWSYNFSKYGIYYVNVSGSNSNGTTQNISWKVIAVLTIIDDLGYEAKIWQKPWKIVSLASSNTEILFAIGVGDRVVGVTEFCDYPPEMVALRNNGSIKVVGNYIAINREEILNLSPDLIIAAHGNKLEDIAFLKQNNLTVITLYPKNIEDILRNIVLLGKVCAVESNAIVLTSNMKARINMIAAKTAGIQEHQKHRVLYVIWHDPIWTAGNGTFVNDVISKAGGINIASKLDGWKIMNPENIIQENPEVIIISAMGAGKVVYSGVINNSAIQQTDAYKTNRIYIIEDPNIIERPGPRIVEGLEEVYNLIQAQTSLTPAKQPSGFDLEIFILAIVIIYFVLGGYHIKYKI
jgi:iron complex transport system substrate-binding protein